MYFFLLHFVQICRFWFVLEYVFSIEFVFRVYLKDTDGQSQGIPCVLQKFNKDGLPSDESPGLMVRDD